MPSDGRFSANRPGQTAPMDDTGYSAGFWVCRSHCPGTPGMKTPGIKLRCCKEARQLTTQDPGQIQLLAAQSAMLVTRLRDDEYLLYDLDTNHLILGSRSGQHTTGVPLEQIRKYLEKFASW